MIDYTKEKEDGAEKRNGLDLLKMVDEPEARRTDDSATDKVPDRRREVDPRRDDATECRDAKEQCDLPEQTKVVVEHLPMVQGSILSRIVFWDDFAYRRVGIVFDLFEVLALLGREFRVREILEPTRFVVDGLRALGLDLVGLLVGLLLPEDLVKLLGLLFSVLLDRVQLGKRQVKVARSSCRLSRRP